MAMESPATRSKRLGAVQKRAGREPETNRGDRHMSVNGIGPNSPIQKVVQQPIHKQTPAAETETPMSSADKLELSGMSHLLKALKQNQDVRVDKVAQIKAQIESDAYETPDKLDIAADRLLDDLLK
jgi:anti-sigma28 factor (negative regulator of flagellin synthesis)